MKIRQAILKISFEGPGYRKQQTIFGPVFMSDPDPKRTFVGPKRQNLSLSGSPRLLILVRLKSFSRKLRQARRTG